MDRPVTYIIFLVTALALSYIFHAFFLNKSKKYPLKKANPFGIRWGSQSKPVSGGITFFAVFIIAIICYFFVFDINIITNSKFIGIILAVTISFLMGLADDIINTSPVFKFLVQLLSGIILIQFDIFIDITPYPYLNYFLTVVWVVGIMNSINMLDNMDAITTIVSACIVTGIIVNILILRESNHSFFLFVSLGVLASLSSFLIFNWHPSKMYMGDNGSQFLGAFFASFGILFFWNNIKNGTAIAYDKQIITVGFAFLIPVIDTCCVTINRLLRRRSPFIGGKDHTAHHLSYLGLSDKSVALILGGFSLISVAISLFITNRADNWIISHSIGFSILGFLMFIIFFVITRTSKPNNK